MAKNYYTLFKGMSGKLGPITFRSTKNGSTIISRSITQNNSRSRAQQLQKMQFINISAIYTVCRGLLDRHFERRKERQSVYNAFVSANLTNNIKVYLTKPMKQMGGSILAPYCISMGTLQSIEVNRSENTSWRSNIALGQLSIRSDTTIAEFSKAIVIHNMEYGYGDSIAFLLGIQKQDTVADTPRAMMYRYEVTLCSNDSRKLWDVVSWYGFQSQQGYLTSRTDMPEGALAWIHLRNGETTESSTQHLVMNNTLYKQYSTEEAFSESALSYGGYVEKKYDHPCEAHIPFMDYPSSAEYNSDDTIPYRNIPYTISYNTDKVTQPSSTLRNTEPDYTKETQSSPIQNLQT